MFRTQNGFTGARRPDGNGVHPHRDISTMNQTIRITPMYRYRVFNDRHQRQYRSALQPTKAVDHPIREARLQEPPHQFVPPGGDELQEAENADDWFDAVLRERGINPDPLGFDESDGKDSELSTGLALQDLEEQDVQNREFLLF